MLIKSHSGVLHFCTHAIPRSGACEKFRPGSSRSPTSNYQNGRAPCSFYNTLEWVSSASCSEPERLCSLSLKPEQVVLCSRFRICHLPQLPLHSTEVLHLDYNSVVKPLYVHVDCYLMLLGCRKGFYQLQVCCSTSPLRSPPSA